ncbi:MAG TPA: phage tail tape measure protein, partial [Thermoleophilia bacterium]|nr:phage tail tape measure protein [Thermoleophilia bacterium]
APLLGAAKVFSSMGDSMGKMAKRTGFSVEALSELAFAAQQSGTDIGSLENALRRMQRSIYDAGRDLSTAVDVLADLGLTFDELNGMAPDKQFALLADRISQIEDPTTKAAIAMTLFGRSGTQLLPMMAAGAKGIEDLREKARRLGLTMSEEDAAAAEVFTDAMDSMWKSVKMGVFHIGSALAPVLQDVANKITEAAVRFGQWAQANRDTIITVLRVTAGILAGGAALLILGTAISAVGSVLGAFTSVVVGAIAVMKLLAAAFMFILSPVGAVIAIVAALGSYLVYASGVGGEALAWLGGKFNTLKEDALAAFGGISDALAAGDMGLAMKVLWLTLKMEWTRGVNFLKKAWLDFTNFFLKKGVDAWHGFLVVSIETGHAITVGWTKLSTALQTIWSKMGVGYGLMWEDMKSFAKRAWTWIKGLFDDSSEKSRAAVYKKIEFERDRAATRIQEGGFEKEHQLGIDRKRRLDQQSAVYEDMLREIGQENLSANDVIDEEFQKKISKNETDLADARAEWQAALKEAKEKRKAKEAADGGPGKLEGPEDWLAKAKEGLKGLGQQAIKATGATGTFSAAVLTGLQAGDATDKIATATATTAANTGKLVRKADKGVLRFS